MKLPDKAQEITVYYDGHCGMCCSFQEWIYRQERLAPIRFIPYQSLGTEAAPPRIRGLDPGREMVVHTREDLLYQGAEAWVICLYALTEYRGWALRLSSPTLLPLAKKVCTHLATNRRRLSKIFFRKKDAEVARELHKMPPRPAARLENFCTP